MNFLNKNFKVVCEKYDYIEAIAEENKLLYRINDEPDFEVLYDDNFDIIKVSSDRITWENDDIKENDNFGIFQKFKNYDPRFIVKKFKKISEDTYFQQLESPFPGFNSHHVFKFDGDSYVKKSFLNGIELTEQELSFKIFY